MDSSENILFRIGHSCTLSFSVSESNEAKFAEELKRLGVDLIRSKLNDGECIANISGLDYVHFKLRLSELITLITKYGNVGSDNKFEYSVELPEVNASKFEFAVNYGHTGGNETDGVNRYVSDMLGYKILQKGVFGWRGITPISLGNDTVITNNNIERLIYPHYIINMREYNKGVITLSCGYCAKWLPLSAMCDYFASFAAGCASRKLDISGVEAVNELKKKFNEISAGFADYASFMKMTNGDYKVSMDMNDEPTYIDAFFSMIKPELFRIYNTFNPDLKVGDSHIFVNYDTDEGRWQVKNYKCAPCGLDDVRNIDIVKCDISNTLICNCNMMDCKIKECTLNDSSIIGDSTADSCILNNCYCGMSTCLTSCHIENNNTMDGTVKHSKIEDNNSYTDNARFFASRNKNNHKV